MDYAQINAISTEIRQIHDTSRAVNMAALNATLVARQAGDARGFHAVAEELRGFSRQLSQEMDQMSRHVFMLAMRVSVAYKNGHRLRLFEAAQRVLVSANILDGTIAQRSYQQQDAAVGIQQVIQNIRTRIGIAKQLCNSGRALSRSAMIEASYSATSVSKLRIVAINVEQSVSSIYDGLKIMDSRLS